MGWFRRKPRGRHALGAAVTELPSAPVVVAPPAPPATPPADAAVGEPDLLTSIAELIATGEAWNEPAVACLDLSAASVAPLRDAPPADGQGTSRGPSAPEEVTAGSDTSARPLVPARDLAVGDVVAGASELHHEPVPDVAAPAPAVLPPVLAVPAVAGPVGSTSDGAATAALRLSQALFKDALELVVPTAPSDTEPDGPSGDRVSGVESVRAEGLASHPDDTRQPVPSSAPPARAPEAPATSATVPVQAGPRVELGFRDGTSASLDPSSEQALALAEISELLNARD